MNIKKTLITTSIVVAISACTDPSSPKSSETEVDASHVTAENYIKAEVDSRMLTFQERAGGINKFYLFSEPTPTDEQPVVRMNRDTMYGGSVIDTEKGATVTIPEMPDDRYFSLMLLDNNHYTIDVLTTPGKHKIPANTTKYIIAVPRIQLYDAHDQKEIDMLADLLKEFKIEADSADQFKANWNWEEMLTLRAEYEKEFVKFEQYPADWQDTKASGNVNEDTRHLAIAGAWGLFPEWESVYINYTGPSDPTKCYTATYTVPKNNAFWSITVYGNDAFMKGDNVTLNENNTTFNNDGSFTAYYGSEEACGVQHNRLDITEGWNFLMRVYRPDQSILDREYTLPAVKEFQPKV